MPFLDAYYWTHKLQAPSGQFKKAPLYGLSSIPDSMLGVVLSG
jgi:hypothetical protein